MTGMKICSKCLALKPLSDFDFNPGGLFGVRGDCKACSKAYRESRSEKIKAYMKEYNKYRPKELTLKVQISEESKHNTRLKCWKRYRDNNRPKTRAREMVKLAIKGGSMVRPTFCSKCFTTKGTIYAHHEDYSKPFDVVWVCRKCHFARHREMKKMCPYGGGK